MFQELQAVMYKGKPFNQQVSRVSVVITVVGQGRAVIKNSVGVSSRSVAALNLEKLGKVTLHLRIKDIRITHKLRALHFSPFVNNQS